MYYTNKPEQSKIIQNNSYTAESLEEKIQRLMSNKQPIDGQVDLIYQEREEGVQAAYNIRTDRWDVALEAKEAVEASYAAKRQMKMGDKTYDTMTPEQQKKHREKFPESKFAGDEGNTPKSI